MQIAVWGRGLSNRFSLVVAQGKLEHGHKTAYDNRHIELGKLGRALLARRS